MDGMDGGMYLLFQMDKSVGFLIKGMHLLKAKHSREVVADQWLDQVVGCVADEKHGKLHDFARIATVDATWSTNAATSCIPSRRSCIIRAGRNCNMLPDPTW